MVQFSSAAATQTQASKLDPTQYGPTKLDEF
jgi:hypothetical protein